MFSMLAFLGIFEIKIIFEIATIASVIEIMIAILDTPSLYLAKCKTKVKFNMLKEHCE